MKTLSALALTACLAFTLAMVGCADNNSAPSPEVTAAANKVETNVQGMTCSGCTGEVTAAVEQVAGVTGAHADLKTGKVTVALADDADADTAKAEVEKVIAGLSDGKYTIAVSTQDPATLKTCPEGCTKACCAGDKDAEAKTCPADCDKPCCAEKNETSTDAEPTANTCPEGCTKACCQKA